MRHILRLISALIDLGVLLLFMVLFLFGAYTVYDINQIYVDASSVKFETFKPTAEDPKTFEDFQKKNEDVIGWLTVYGTNIDHPLVYSEEFNKYINTDPEGNFSLAGSIFLDHRNKPDFSDFKTIIYGHHMEKHEMFGDIDQYSKKEYFDEHRYGNIYFDGKDWGVDFFIYLEGDAYDSRIYDVGIATEEEITEFLDFLKEEAQYQRNVEVTPEDHLVILSTCAGDTNGRYLLVGKLTEETYEDIFVEEEPTRTAYLAGEAKKYLENMPWWWRYMVIVLFVILLLLLVLAVSRRRKHRR